MALSKTYEALVLLYLKDKKEYVEPGEIVELDEVRATILLEKSRIKLAQPAAKKAKEA